MKQGPIATQFISDEISSYIFVNITISFLEAPTLCIISSISSITASDITHTWACSTRTWSICRGQYRLRSHGRMDLLDLPLLTGLLGCREASVLCDGGRSRSVPLPRGGAVPPGHPPGRPCWGAACPSQGCWHPWGQHQPALTVRAGKLSPTFPEVGVCNLKNRR